MFRSSDPEEEFVLKCVLLWLLLAELIVAFSAEDEILKIEPCWVIVSVLKRDYSFIHCGIREA